jgi:hypothetical protein
MAATSGLSLKTFGYGIALPIGLAILGNIIVTNPTTLSVVLVVLAPLHLSMASLVGLWLCQDPGTLFLQLHRLYWLGFLL